MFDFLSPFMEIFVTLAMIIRTLLSAAKKSEAGSSSSPVTLDVVIHEGLSDQAAKIMEAEVADLKKSMREFLLTCEKYIYFGGLIAVGAVTLGVTADDRNDATIIYIFAPYPLGLTYIYLLQIFTEIEMRAGYVKFLEEKICHHVGAEVVLFSKVNAWGNRNRFSTWGAQILNLVALLLLAGFSIRESLGSGSVKINSSISLEFQYLNMFFLGVTLAAISAAVWEMTHASAKAYTAAEAAYTA